MATRALSARWTPGSDRLIVQRDTALISVDLRARATVLARGELLGIDFSPDARRIAYVRVSDSNREGCPGGGDLYVVDATGGRPSRLTHDGRSYLPVWGPGQIAFARRPRGDCTFGGVEIWTVRPEGSHARRLAGLPRRKLAGGIYGLEPLAWSSGSLLGGIATEFADWPVAVDPVTGRIKRFGDELSAISLSRDGRRVLVMRGGAEAPFTIGWIPFGGGRFHSFASGDVAQPSWNR